MKKYKEEFEFTPNSVYKSGSEYRSHKTSNKLSGIEKKDTKMPLRPSEEELLKDVKNDLIKKGLFKQVIDDDSDTSDVTLKGDGTVEVRSDKTGKVIMSKKYESRQQKVETIVESFLEETEYF